MTMNKVGFFRSIQLKFIIIYILLLLVAIQVIGSYVSRELETKLIDTFQGSVNDRVELLTYNLTQVFNKERDDGQEPTIQEEIQDILTGIDTGTITNLQVVNKDRKSTRLNSSHVAISYAVFCLKKKTREAQ